MQGQLTDHRGKASAVVVLFKLQEGVSTLKRSLLAIMTVIALLLALLAGCGGAAAPDSAPAEESASAPAAEDAVQPSAEEVEAPDTPAEASEESVQEPAAQEPEETGYEPRIHFPGEDTARLHYSNTYELPISEDGATLTWMRTALNLMGPLGELGLTELQDLDAIQELQKRTGVTIDYTEIDFWTASEKMNIAIASGDYPAIISNLLYAGGDTAAATDDVIVDLTDYLEEYSPNYYYLINSNPDEAGIFRSDGKVLAYRSPYDNFVQNQGMVVRKDWLEEQGLDVPETYDEMFNVLTTFRDAYAGITPIYMNAQCTINGLVVGYDVASFAADGFGSSLPYYAVDGEVHCTLLEDGYKDYLMEMNKWYNEGLFAKDFASIQYNPMGGVLGEMTSNGTVGVWCTSGEGINNIYFPVTCVPNLTLEKGGKDHLTSTSLLTDSDNTYITSCCDDIETAMRFLDYLYSEDGILFYNYGFEGIDFELDENNTPQFTDAVVNNEYGVDVQNMLRIRRPFTLCSSMMVLYATAAYNTDLKNEAWDVWTSNMDGEYFIPTNVTMNADETETAGYYGTDILTYACETIPQFISGEIGFDQWDSFIQRLHDMSIDECIAAEQSAYDRCME